MTELELLWARHDWAGYTALAVFVGLAVWKRYAPDIWDLLPGWTQFAIPFVVVGGTAFSETLAKDQAATLVAAVFQGLGAALGLVGGYHGAKRAPLLGRLLQRRAAPSPAERETDPPESKPPTEPPASVTASSLLLVVCAGLGLAAAIPLVDACQPAKSASDAMADVCRGYLAASPEVQAEAERQGVSPLVVAEAVCLLNDAGRLVWQLFGDSGQLGSAPQQQLETAKARALVVARQQGKLP